MIRIIIALLLSCPVFAEDLYFTQSGSGSHNGTIGNPWSTSEASTAGNWGSGAGKISAGDTLHGAAGATITSSLIVQGSGTDDSNRITILFDSGCIFTAPTWGFAGGGIKLTGKNWITINGDITNGRQGIINCTANGEILANQDPCAGVFADGCTGLTVKNLTINNIFVRPAGTLVAGNGVGAFVCNYQSSTVYTDFVVDNVYGTNAYIGIDSAFSGTGSSRYTFTNCNFTKANWGIHVGGNTSGSKLDDVTIYGCTFGDYSNWDDPTPGNAWHHNGIFFAPQDAAGGGYVHNIQIYKNTFNDGYGTRATSGIYANGGDFDATGVIYDNVFYCPTDYPSNGLITLALETGRLRVYNNSAVAASGSGADFISVSGQFGATASKIYDVYNNVSVNCIMQYAHDMTGTGTTLNQNNNIAYGTTLGGSFYYFDTGANNLAAWQARGYDNWIANPNVDPKYVSSSNMHLQSGSPCTSSGADESAFFTTDFDGVAWAGGVGWGIGAYKFVGAGGAGGSTLTGKITITGNATIR